MLIVTGNIRIATDSLETFKSLAATMAVSSRAEDECHGYMFYQSIEDKQLFRVYEQWTDAAALTFHFNTPHMAEFRKGLASIKIEQMDVVKFEAGESQPIM